MNQLLKNRQCFPSYQQIFGITLLSLYAAITFETSSSIAAPASTLDNWRFNPNKLQLEITLSAGSTPSYFYLAQPPRLVVDIPNTKLGRVLAQQNYSGAIQSVRVSQLNASVTRIVLDLAPGTVLDQNQVQLQPVSRQNPTRWVLSSVIANNSTSSPNNLSPTPYNYQQQPFVTVPPLTPNNSSQLPDTTLPPATFPNQSGNLNRVTVPNYVPNAPNSGNYPANVPEIKVIEFGQPLPKSK
ncbi:Localisation of periplasmic protein complexes [Cylindrospermum stagnale PCC 7417]|uniref:Localisation of periplasmic protein complexes n=1 Tax=Cylindrospermum stagnale PCC 7417 TaxID=56107 RepID=K9WZK2_9NOST|nr:AMIN domain-containing protein [Cylindrospermum stagnale]AFZ25226.1 Localisation of periplasmic protein complexes [Cylindrospermum stagnale PCC 7417]